ncbi:MAG: LysR family transcriptional regulator [Proteobacteria bacterium]|nr:LysR family transcriptional regulator [Pseudomonadota bacterium]
MKWLEDFVTLADTSSFSRAAEIRNVTQPAFSRRIKQLEIWLGATLVSRATMPAELTPAGRNFLLTARETIRTFYAVRETLRSSHEAGLIRFASLHTLTITFFPHWLKTLEQAGGAVGTSLIPDRGGIEANIEALVGDEADFFLTYSHPEVPFHLDRGQFESLKVAHDRLIPLAAANVTITGGTHRGLHILDRAVAQPWLAVPYLSYGFNSFFGVALSRLLLRRPHFRRRTTHENTISAGLVNMAVTGAGICWLPESLVREEIEKGRLVPASADAGWNLDLEIRLYRHATARNQKVEDFWCSAKQLGELKLEKVRI